MECKVTVDIRTNCTNATSGTINTTYEWNTLGFNASVKNILLAVVLGTLDIVTITGNFLVLLSFVFEKRLVQPFNIYILNLAVTDFLVAITAMTFYTVDTLFGYWPFGIYMCGIWIYFDFAMTFASVFTLVAISVDRFWCVTWPVHFKVHNNKRKTALIIVVIWLCVLAIWTPPFIGDRLGHTEPLLCIWNPSDNTEFVLFVAVIGHYLPCIIMIFCYVKVLLVMRRQASSTCTKSETDIPVHKSFPSDAPNNKKQGRNSNKTVNESPLNESPQESYSNNDPSSESGSQLLDKNFTDGKTNTVFTVQCESNNIQASTSGKELRQFREGITSVPGRNYVSSGKELRQKLKRSSYHLQREKRIFITLSYILSTYIICWFPFYIAFDVSAWHPDLVPAGLYSFLFWSTYINSTLNPFIYAYTNKEFRAAFIKVMKYFCVCSNYVNNHANPVRSKF